MKAIALFDDKTTPNFINEKDHDEGVLWALSKLQRDIENVSGKRTGNAERVSMVLTNIAAESPVIKALEEKGLVDLSGIKGKREVYGYFLVDAPEVYEIISDEDRKGAEPIENSDIFKLEYKNENTGSVLIIAGSDKRGTIYGIFHLSELMGVSPFTDWSNLKPTHKDKFILTEEDLIISKEPSVEYRGFFINDEWPAFGNWTFEHYEGFTAKMYEHVFELLLRLKGNYLWPAMWSSCFALDGPELESAYLADKVGVIMGLSHHEPCLRHGNEYGMVRGKDSIYGDAWNFRANPDGITRFWRDGLKRNGHLENVITVGMRGEADSAIMGKDATLKDNIELLKDVIRTQNRLISEEVNPDLKKVPRMLALYKEVEPFYFGDENTEGLRDFEELKDVILMLCDDNHGYLRSVPDEKMKKHPGGFGMYYHFDYYGDPKSYLWTNTTYLPEVWEQMTTAYENGIKRLWIVNVGDLFFNELPLSYFLDLAYDYDKWGISAKDKTTEYLKEWLTHNFGEGLSDKKVSEYADVLQKGTRLIHNRRTEHLSDEVYHPVHFNETGRLLEAADDVMDKCSGLEAGVPGENKNAFYELIGYSIYGTMNMLKMWLYTGLNHFYAKRSMLIANEYGERINECIKKDKELTLRIHTIDDGRYNGLGLSPHYSFVHWNMEEMKAPVIYTVNKVNEPEAVIGVAGTDIYTAGREWTAKRLIMEDFLRPDLSEGLIEIGLTGGDRVPFTIETGCEWLTAELTDGEVSEKEPLKRIRISLDRARYDENKKEKSFVVVKWEKGNIRIDVPVCVMSDKYDKGVFIGKAGLYTINAVDYSEKHDTKSAYFEVLKECGRTDGEIKLFPPAENISFAPDAVKAEAPFVRYDFYAQTPGSYKVIFYLTPTNPRDPAAGIKLAYSVNDDMPVVKSAIKEGHTPGIAGPWDDGVLMHIRYVETEIECNEGRNSLYFYGIQHENILERIVILREDKEMPYSYLGDEESFRV